MRDAEQMLTTLGNISRTRPDYIFHRVYQNLYNKDLFVNAYVKLAPHEGNMTKGADGKTIDGFGMWMVDEIIEELRFERYHPTPVRRTYIEKKNGKLRPLGIPTFKDKLVQEALREILEAIYEPLFSDSSHGYRPDRSPLTALSQIQYTCSHSTWVVEGDISGFFDNLDHDILLKCIGRKIDDGRILELIRRFLRAGYLEDDSFHESYLGSPQGGVISPILANIYLHEFDTYMELLRAKYEKGESRKDNPAYSKLIGRHHYLKHKGRNEESKEARRMAMKLPSMDPMDPDFVRIRYTRFADDFCIFIAGSKSLALQIKADIIGFLEGELKLKLSEEKTLVTNLADRNVRFLGYEIAKVSGATCYGSLGQRRLNGRITLLMPSDVIREKKSAITRFGKPTHRDELLPLTVEEMITKCNAEISGLYNYYCLASNVAHRMWHYRFYHLGSLLKTIAKKENSTVCKVRRKYGIEVKRKDMHGTRCAFGVFRGDSPPLMYYEGSFTHQKFPPKQFDTETSQGLELKRRLLADTCEVCKAGGVVVHHVRNLSDTIDRYVCKEKALPDWVTMMKRMRRKTLILCLDCHKKLHLGELEISKELLESPLR